MLWCWRWNLSRLSQMSAATQHWVRQLPHAPALLSCDRASPDASTLCWPALPRTCALPAPCCATLDASSCLTFVEAACTVL